MLVMTVPDLYGFLRHCKLGVLSTIGDANVPQSALVGIAVTESLDIVFDRVKSSRKYVNLIARSGCSFVIGWTGEQTVQYEGHADELRGGELQEYQQAYFEVWPECRAHLSWPGIAYFVVRPMWIRYSDFDQSPPCIQEFTSLILNAPLFGPRSRIERRETLAARAESCECGSQPGKE